MNVEAGSHLGCCLKAAQFLSQKALASLVAVPMRHRVVILRICLERVEVPSLWAGTCDPRNTC